MTAATRRELMQPRAWLRAAASLNVRGDAARAAAEVDAPPPPAPHAERVLSDDELAALAASHGLEHRFEELHRLARHSARLLPDPAGASWVASIDDRSDAHREGGQLVICALDVGHLGLAFPTAADRHGATLQLAFDDRPLHADADGLIDCGVASVRLVEPGEDRTSPGGTRMSAAVELSLPRVWSAPVTALGFSEDEAERFTRLREAVARRQGAALFDTVSSTCSFDRVLGYPDETTGRMPERCGGAADGWQLLLQVTAGGWRGLGWRSRPRRIYCWISGSSLASGAFDDVRVFAH